MNTMSGFLLMSSVSWAVKSWSPELYFMSATSSPPIFLKVFLKKLERPTA